MQIDLSLVVSFFAVIISILSIYLQWYRVRGAIVGLLNVGGEQRAVIRPFKGLPMLIQDGFPEYQEKYPGYAVMRLIFANSGDRAGFTKINNVEIINPHAPIWLEEDRVKFSFYSYAVIPAYEINSQDILIRNIPKIDDEIILDVMVGIEWGGADNRSGKYKLKGVIKEKIRVLVTPSSFPYPSQVASIG